MTSDKTVIREIGIHLPTVEEARIKYGRKRVDSLIRKGYIEINSTGGQSRLYATASGEGHLATLYERKMARMER